MKPLTSPGIWHQNPLLVQCLGLCPLLAVSSSAGNALVLGLCTAVVLAFSSVGVALCARFIPLTWRVPVFLLLIASLVSLVELLMKAFWYASYQSLGLFLPLIISNCMILGRAEAFASRNTPWAALQDAVGFGAGFAWVLLLLGASREFLSYGDWPLSARLFDDGVTLSAPWQSLTLLPPGVFFLLATMIATASWLRQRRERPAPRAAITLKNL